MSEQVLISHSSRDNESAQRIKKVLEDNGFSCWLDSDDIPPGADFVKKIAEAMSQCEAVVVLVSKNSQDSDWVRNEVTAAKEQKKLLIPYMIQDFEPDDTFRLCLGNAQRVSGYGEKEEEALRRTILALRDYLKSSSEGEEIKITIKKKMPLKKKLLFFGVGGAVVLAALLAVILPGLGKGGGRNKNALEVYYSEVLPYSKAGYYQNAQSGGEVVKNRLDTNKAFSILSFIRNQGDSAAFVEQIGCDISSLEINDTPLLDGDAWLENGLLKVFAYNDGWGDGKNVPYEIRLEAYGSIPLLGSLKKAVESSGKIDVRSAWVSLVSEIELPLNDIRQFARDNGINFYARLATMYMVFKTKDGERSSRLYIGYDPKDDVVKLDYDGKGDGTDYSITLYAILDVDAHPGSLRFTGVESTPLVDSTFRIETVIIPTKSCKIVCRGVYSVGGKIHETEDYTVTVSVPVFTEGITNGTSKMTRQLYSVDMRDDLKIREILSPWYYDPETVIRYSK